MDSGQAPKVKRKFKLGPLANLHQVTKGLSKTLRAMSTGELDSQVGARIANGLGIMRMCLETATLQRLEAKLDALSGAPEGRPFVEREDRPSRLPH